MLVPNRRSTSKTNLESTGTETLDDTAGKQELITSSSLSNCTPDNGHQSRPKEHGSFAVFARESTVKRSRTADSQQIVTGYDDNVSDTAEEGRAGVEIGGNDNNRRVEEWSDGGSVQHCAKAKNVKDVLFLERRPIERIIGIFRWLWGEDKVRIAAGTVLESTGNGFAVSSFVVEENGPWHMGHDTVFEYSETHFEFGFIKGTCVE